MIGTGTDELLTVKDVAVAVRVSVVTVRRWVEGGELPAAKIGKEYRIRRRDYEQWWDRKRRMTESEVERWAERVKRGKG